MKKHNILVIEDVSPVRYLLQRNFRDGKYFILTAGSGH